MRKTTILGPIFLALIACVEPGEPAQEDTLSGSPALAAAVDYGNGQVFRPRKRNTDFERLGLNPRQSVSITISYPTEMAGQSISVAALDGGTVNSSAGGLVVDPDGTITFQFEAGDIPGHSRVAVHQPNEVSFLKFWVLDSQNPTVNPHRLLGAY